MRVFPIMVGLVFIALFGTAQSSSFGLSVNSLIDINPQTSVLLDDGDVFEYELMSFGKSNSISFGVSHMSYLNNRFYFHKEVLYTRQTSNFDLLPLSDNLGAGIGDITRNIIQVPIAAGVTFKNIIIGAGPTFNFNVAQSNIENLSQVFDVRKNNVSFGFQFQLGYQITNKINILGRLMTSFDGATSGLRYRNEAVRIPGSPRTLAIGINYSL